MSADKQAMSPPTALDYKRSEGFTDYYANNAQYQTSAWDLRIIFGQLDQTLGPNTIVQQGSITVSWPTAKTLLFFLQLQVTGHELEAGRIAIPPNIIPEIPATPPENLVVSHENWRILRKVYEDFMAANPEAKPPGSKA